MIKSKISGSAGDFESYLSEEMLKLRTNRESRPELNSTMCASIGQAVGGSSAQLSQGKSDTDTYSDMPVLLSATDDDLYDCGKEAWEIKCENNENPAPASNAVKDKPQSLPKENELKTFEDALLAMETNGEWVYELCTIR
jgi:hypothetical protein